MSSPTTSPVPAHSSSIPAALVSPPVTPPLMLYDVNTCDRACPFCDRTFSGKVGDARKSLAKHVNAHQPNPSNSRFQTWLGATSRAWCSVCQLSYSQKLKHVCGGVREVVSQKAAPAVSEPGVVIDDVKGINDVEEVSPSCLLPSLMDVFMAPIPTVKRIPQQCRVSVARRTLLC